LRLLTLLLERPGELVTRDTLRAELWPVDTFVDFDHGLNAAMRKLRFALGDSGTKSRYIETRSKHGYRFASPVEVVHNRQIESLAVLPFVDSSGESDAHYFADGITDQLITLLAKIGSLRVISRTSAMRYQGTRKPISEIGRELRVDAIVEGAVHCVGTTLRLNAQLIDALTDIHLWAESYESEIHDILFLQSTLATAIVRAIKIQLTGQEHTTLGRAHPVVTSAYESYVRGRHAWGKGTSEDLKRAAIHFEAAIEQDPTFALAYVGLADSYLVRSFYSVLAPRYGYPRAKAAATKAIELDPTSGEALASLANVYLNFEWNWKAAEITYTRALSLSPGYATAHQWSGQLAAIMGRFEEAIGCILRAHELDPLSIRISSMIGWPYYLARRYERAREHLSVVVEEAPDSALSHFWLGQTLQQIGMWQDAIAELERAVSLFGSHVGLGVLASAYAGAGCLPRAKALICEMHELERTSRHVSAYALAEAYVGVGEPEQAFTYLRKAYAQREPMLLFIGVEPRMDPLRGDPRFAQLLADIGLASA
jgi:TolB-like protein/tetratricopeptide (TPR) repeat protein